MNQDKYEKFFIGFSFLIFILMCYMYVKYPFMKVDEGYTMGMINLSVGDMISVTANDFHSPLYYLIVMFFTSLNVFNVDLVYVMKFASIISYLIILALSLTKIKKDYGILTSGIFLFAITSMSTFFMFYLTARSYSWSLLALLLTFIVLKDLIDSPNLKSWILLSLTSVLCAYLHYFAAISAFAIYLMLFAYLIIKNKSEIKNFFISVALAVVLYLPWMFTLFSQMSSVKKGYWIEPVSLGSLLTCSSYYLTAFTNKLVLIVSALIFW